jgi:four helix bundle protein
MEDKRIQCYDELRVYQVAFALQQDIFDLTKRFPKEESYSLTDQIRRSSRSIGANSAEAWQKRRYPAHFISKLSDADGEQAETIHWLATALACAFISPAEHKYLMERTREIGGMLGKMMHAPEKWCSGINNQ